MGIRPCLMLDGRSFNLDSDRIWFQNGQKQTADDAFLSRNVADKQLRELKNDRLTTEQLPVEKQD